MAHKTYTLNVHGMHCNACVVLTESELAEHPSVASAKSNLHTRTVEITGDFGEMSLDQIASELSKLLSQHKLSTEVEQKKAKWDEFKIAVPIALGFVILFVLLQKIGIVNLVSAGNVTYGTAFAVGIVASLSTCMAVVGGLVLSMSATASQKLRSASTYTSAVYFHVARLVAFFILGGVIGTLGSAFALGRVGTFVLALLVGLVMLVLGLNLLDIFSFTKRLTPSMPKFIGKHALGVSEINHTLTPALVGVATFFLPCGFTQSMQLYALTTGSFGAGALTMLFFALGTLPVLALISFSSFSIKSSSKSGVFFKSAGLIVILFAIFNIINSLVVIGLIRPIFNF